MRRLSDQPQPPPRHQPQLEHDQRTDRHHEHQATRPRGRERLARVAEVHRGHDPQVVVDADRRVHDPDHDQPQQLAVVDVQLLWLVLVGVVNSAISIYYYLRIVTAMYFREATAPFGVTRSPGLVFVMALMPIVVLELGILPSWWLNLVG